MEDYQKLAKENIEVWMPYIRFKKPRGRGLSLTTFIYVSNLGNVKGHIFNSCHFTQDMIKLNSDDRRCLGKYPIFHLVWSLFMGESKKGYDVHHIDHNKLNDRLDNLVMIPKSKHILEHPEIFINSETTKEKKRRNLKKYSDNTKGKHRYNNGEIEILAFECPEGFTLGRLKPAWNTGLTKETDERVAKYGETHSENNKNKCQ